MSLSTSEVLTLRLCKAVLSRNQRELEWVLSRSTELESHDLVVEARTLLASVPTPGQHALIDTTRLLPSWMQYLGQRAVLLFPRVARRLLMSSGLHHQMF